MTNSASATPASIDEIDLTTSEQLDAIVAAVPYQEVAALTERLRTRKQELPLNSGEGAEIVGLCKQTLVVGGALLALIAPLLAEKYSTFEPLGKKLVFFVGFLAIGLWALSLLTLGFHLLFSTFRYPFLYLKRTGNAWPYFYYAALDPLTPRGPIAALNSEKMRTVGATYYARDLIKIADQVVGETSRDMLRNELQQYFLLLSYMGYSHQFSLWLSRLYFVGLVGLFSSILMIALLACWWP